MIRWFILHPMLDRDQLGPIIDYLQHQRFVPLVGARPGDAAPQQPLLTMKGRSPQTLLRHVEQWHRGLARGNRVQIREWAASGYAGLNYSEGMADRDSFRRWTIRELVSGSALLAEGRQMKHCVATYAASCARGMASIWTLEVESRDGCEKLLTIEVRNSARLICQARGRMNRMPTQRELNLLHRWAATAGLSVSNYLE